MPSTLQRIRRGACAVGIAATAALAAAQNTPTLPDSGNYIDLSLGYLDLDGNEASFLQDHGVKKHAFGGIEAFNYYAALPNYTDLYLSGKAIEDNGDYAIRLKIVNTEVGYVDASWQENRYWYDGTGGFLPADGGYAVSFRDDELSLTRGEIKIAGGLTLPDMPRIELSYTHRYREGIKSSTVWGDSNLTGGLGTRGIIPAYLNVDEETDTLEAKVSGTVSNTNATLALRVESTEGDNARLIARRTGETAERRVTQRETYETDLFNARTTTITRFGEKTTVTTGVSYTTIDAETRGSRIYGAGFDAVFDPTFRRQNRDEGFLDLHSQSDSDQWVVNGNVMFLPRKNLKAIIALRAEDLSSRTDSDVVETNFVNNVASAEELVSEARSHWNDYAASAELIYTGQKDAVYTASALYSFGDGDLDENEIVAETGETDLFRNTDIERSVSKVAVGAKFYPSREVSYYLQAYRKERHNDYDNVLDSTAATGGDRFPAYQNLLDFTVNDVNARLNWKPLPGVSSVSRIDFQTSTIDNRMDGLEKIEASRNDTVIYSQILSWMTEKVYLQTSFNFVYDDLKTPASRINVIGLAHHDFSNDYVSGDLVAQWAAGDDADMIFRAYYLKADNYIDASSQTVPYATDFTERGATLSWSKPLRDNMRLTLQYGYYTKDDPASGGLNDYDAQILSSKIRYRF